MHVPINPGKGEDELIAFAAEARILVHQTQRNPTKTYAIYRRLQLETALSGNISDSAQYAALAKAVDVSQSPCVHHRRKAN